MSDAELAAAASPRVASHSTVLPRAESISFVLAVLPVALRLLLSCTWGILLLCLLYNQSAFQHHFAFYNARLLIGCELLLKRDNMCRFEALCGECELTLQLHVCSYLLN